MTDIGDIALRLAGRFVVIDGPDGAGKGTQIALLGDALRAAGATVVNVHDPGGTPAGDLIRQILLHSGQPLDVRAETLLFMASRAQLAAEKIRPALAAGATVLSDRFISSTCAYQGAAGADLAAIIELGRFAVGETWPDLTVVLDLPAEEGLKRIGVANGRSPRAAGKANSPNGPAQGALFRDVVPDSMETRGLAFHRRVREIFRDLPGVYPKPVEIVSAAGQPDAVQARVAEALAKHFA